MRKAGWLGIVAGSVALIALGGCSSSGSSGSKTTDTVTVTASSSGASSGSTSTSPKPSTTTSAADTRCHTSGLTLTRSGSDAGAGQVYTTFVFKNITSTTCTMFGFPGFSWLSASSTVIGAPATRDTATPALVTLVAGASAKFVVHDTNPGIVPACSSNPAVGFVEVFPPDETAPIKIPVTGTTCNPVVAPVQAA